MRFLIISVIFVVMSLANDLQEVLSQKDITVIENGILKEAIKNKNYNDITSIAISFFATSKNQSFQGNKDSLEKRALYLLNLASEKGNISAGNFLVLNYLHYRPIDAHLVAKKIIQTNLKTPSNEYLKVSKTFVTALVALTLDHYSTNVNELNFALEALDSLKIDTPQINLFRAFIFKALDSDDLADIFLTKACSRAIEPKIVNFCKDFEL